MKRILAAIVLFVTMLAGASHPPRNASAFAFGPSPSGISHLKWQLAGMPKPQTMIIGYYAWGEWFQSQFAAVTYAHGAEPFIELGSWQCTWLCPNGQPTLQQIASGNYDQSYLIPFAKQLAAYGHPVLVTFDHEMNGLGWYPWQQGAQGSGSNPPGDWIAAWDHVYTLMHPVRPQWRRWYGLPTSKARDLVTFSRTGRGRAMWTSGELTVTCRLLARTYASQIAPTVAAIRDIASKPGFLGARRELRTQGRPPRVTALVRAARTDGLTGLVWFDEGGSYLKRPGQRAMARTRLTPLDRHDTMNA